MRRIKVDPIREIALDILIKVENNQGYINVLVNDILKKNNIKKRDAAFIQEIVYGVVRNRIKIDWVISKFTSRKLKKIHLDIINIIRMGVYQILELSKIPEYAICNEGVQLAKKYSSKNIANFVNAILRNIIRRKEEIEWPDPQKNRAIYLSIIYSHPLWIIKRWLKIFGYEDTLKICKANNTIPPLTVRINNLKIDRFKLIKQLEAEGITVEKGQFAEEALYLKGLTNVSESAFFKDGLLQVQDESSMLVSHLLNPQSGEFVMDICSAPGGKTSHIAQLMHNTGIVISMDINEKKINNIFDNSQRLGISIVKPVKHDATKIQREYLNIADKVLVDAPCSCLGVLRRKPDIKLRVFNKKRLLKLSGLQKEILLTASKYVKKEGILVYSTCTTETEENEVVIMDFLKKNPNFMLDNLREFNKNRKLKVNLSKNKHFIKIYPGISNSRLDGFFMARLIRKE
jgi:16S rRNA (cytosine967-C5)-methyltransferase